MRTSHDVVQGSEASASHGVSSEFMPGCRLRTVEFEATHNLFGTPTPTAYLVRLREKGAFVRRGANTTGSTLPCKESAAASCKREGLSCVEWQD